MKTSTPHKLITFLLCCLLSTYSYTQILDHVSGEVLVKIRPNKSAAEKTALKNRMNANTLKTYSQFGIELWQVNDATDIKALANEYRYDATLEFIEPNYIYTLYDDFSSTNHKSKTSVNSPSEDGSKYSQDPLSDPLLDSLWGLHNTGQNGGTADADIDATEAWDITTGSPAVKVAIIDTGIDYEHEDLVDNIWQNLGEDIDGDGKVLEWDSVTEKWIFDPDDENGIDDDENGYADDFVGWNFISNTNDPYDDRVNMAHGTHVAGTIGATGNNGIGIAGVTWDVQMAALKIFGAMGSAPQSASIEAFNYAITMGFPISNNSWGGSHFTNAMYAVLQHAQDNNHLCIFAAGNNTTDNDQYPHYPASYPFDNIISVANIDNNDALYIGLGNYNGSQYGATTVDIAAPGTDILSTLRGNVYGSYTGTSMAAPHVTGACALLWGLHPTYSYTQIKSAILNSADQTPAMNGKCVSDGRLNLNEAINYVGVPPPSQCRYGDSLTLVEIYNLTDGPGWSWNVRWNLTQPMHTWWGVTLNDEGCVEELFPPGDMDGTIPITQFKNLESLKKLVLSYHSFLTGGIPPEIGDMTNLTYLQIFGNYVLGGTIPPEIGNLVNLEYLDLYNNDLSGTIPAEIGNLTKLKVLKIWTNNLTGDIPTEIGNLINLEELWLSSNDLSGTIPQELTNLVNLKHLTLRHNELSGNIPLTISNMASLENLQLGYNNLTGVIPTQLTGLNNLNNLDLTGNNLNGVIPIELGTINSLLHLGLNYNNLSGVIPVELTNLTNLQTLSLSGNNLTGGIPVEIGNMVDLTRLDLSNNNLGGTIPVELANLSNLYGLYLRACSLTGNIPPELGSLPEVTQFWLHENQLSGSIPPELSNLDKAYDLFLNDNQLTGSIPPELGEMERLGMLYLEENQLSGSIPPELGNISTLTRLWLNDNLLTGSIPPEISNCNELLSVKFQNNQLSGCYHPDLININYNLYSGGGVNAYISDGNNFDTSWEDFRDNGAGACFTVSPCRQRDSLALVEIYNSTNGPNWSNTWDLNQPIDTWYGVTVNGFGCVGVLDLIDNQLNGSLPPELGDLTNLRYLYLAENQLTGSIPTEIGNLTNLSKLDLQENSLNGSIPTEIGNLIELQHLYLDYNQLTGSIPIALQNLSRLEYLHLHANQLSGTIPAEIGQLSNLIELICSSNGLSGVIPPQIGNLNDLTYLSFGYNQLSGTIPSELGGLPKITKLYLNNNQLTGSIPLSFGSLPNIQDLHLNNNQLSGTIPSELGNAETFQNLYLYNNLLTGAIPKEFSNLTEYLDLRIYNNQLSGCYDMSLSHFCIRSTNSYISEGNNFNTSWEDFCALGLGTCAQVYPGDFNNDGIANETDCLYWGLAHGNSGPVRPNASTTWVGQDCPDWTQDVQGINGKHQDGNGDSTVTDTDKQVLLDNFGETHSFTQPAYVASSTIYRLEELPPSGGNPRYELYVEDPSGVPVTAHGVAFTFQSDDIDINNVTMDVTNSSLQPYDTLTVYDTDQNKFHIALTRNDGDNRTLSGAVAEFIVMTNDVPDGGEFDLNISNGTQIQADGTLSSIASTTAYGTKEGSDPTSSNMILTVVVTHAQCNIAGQAKAQILGDTSSLTYAWNTGANTQTITDLTLGIYEVTVTDLNGEMQTRSAEVYGQYIPIFDENGVPVPCNPNLCPTLLTPGGNVPSGTYQANTAVNSDGTIPTNGNVQYKSGDIIILNGNFEVQPGANFEAIIEDCGSN